MQLNPVLIPIETTGCPRCKGFMIKETWPASNTNPILQLRCINCGERLDSAILSNRTNPLPLITQGEHVTHFHIPVQKVLELAQEGLTITEIADWFDVPYNTIARIWKRYKYRTGGRPPGKG